MAVAIVVYDAQSMGALIGAEAPFPAFGAVPIVIAAFVAAYSIARTPHRPTSESIFEKYKFLPAAPILLVMGLLPIGFWSWGQYHDFQWAQELTAGKLLRLDGCVRDFSETISDDGRDIGTDDFTVSGRRFEISDSVWQLGYHTSRHHGSPIGPNAHLVILADKETHMLKIEVFPTMCAETSA